MSQALAKGCTRMTPQQPYNVDEVFTHSTDVAAEAQSNCTPLPCLIFLHSTAHLAPDFAFHYLFVCLYLPGHKLPMAEILSVLYVGTGGAEEMSVE